MTQSFAENKENQFAESAEKAQRCTEEVSEFFLCVSLRDHRVLCELLSSKENQFAESAEEAQRGAESKLINPSVYLCVTSVPSVNFYPLTKRCRPPSFKIFTLKLNNNPTFFPECFR